MPHFNAGQLLRQAGRLEEAVAMLRIAATLEPNLPEAWAALEEFVGRDLEEYTQKCVRLATAADTSTRLRTFRAGIRERLRRSAVCDTVAFARAMEEQYLRVLEENRQTSGA